MSGCVRHIMLVSLVALGCQNNVPQPLTSEIVSRALAQPDQQEIDARIRAFHHPLLHANNFRVENGITPDEAGILAVLLNPNLNAERAKPMLADARLLQSTILPNPSLNFSLDQPIGKRSSGEVTGYGLGIDWEITSLISHNAKVRAAQAAVNQVRLDLLWKEWQVAEAAKSAAFDVLALQRKRAATKELSDRLAKVADHANQALAKHDLTASDASAAQAAADDAKVSLAEIERDFQDAKLAFNAAIGFAPEFEVVILERRTPTQLPDPATLVADIDHRRIDLAALRQGYESQEATVRAAILNQFPKITLGISNTRDYGNFLTLGPTATADLPFFDRNQGNIAIEKATREQLKQEFVARVFEARSDIARASTLLATLDKVIAAKAAEVESLKTFVNRSQDALNNGNVDINAFYVAAVSLNGKQIELIKDEQDRGHAIVALELAAGVDLNQANPLPATQQVSP